MNEHAGLPVIHVKQAGELSTYDIAKQALALAVTVDEAKAIHDDAERMAFYARQANDRELIADAMALVMQARRRLGELLIKAKEAGQLSRGGRPSKEAETSTRSEQVFTSPGSGQSHPQARVTLKEAGIDRKLSSEAQKLAGYAEDDFEAVIEKGRQKIRAGGAVVINPVKDLNTREKQLHRDVREAVLAAKQKALPEKKFGVFLADPEWPDDTWSEAGKDRSPENHYPTSTIAVIAARPVETIAADDAVMGLWIPMRHLAVGNHVTVMRGWGFEPKAILIWDKVVTGTGFWVRNRLEALVIGVRGKVPAPAPGTQWEDLVVSPKGAHSEKPDWAYDWFETYFPNLPKIELNARRRRDGWDAWGFEAPEDDSRDTQREFGTAREASDGSVPESQKADGIAGLQQGIQSAPHHISIRPDELVEPAGGVSLAASPAVLDTVAAGPETDVVQSDVLGGGEGVTALPAGPRLTREEAEPILRQRYATTDVGELQRILGGVPVNTIRSWAFKLGLTNVARRTAQLVERNKALRGQHQMEAGEHAGD
jgi:N6-adenosine-specific RNA methylase IME4